MELKAKARRWGSSLGIILPKGVVETHRIREDDEIVVEIKKQTLAKELFGKYPRASRKTAQEIKDDMRAGWGP